MKHRVTVLNPVDVTDGEGGYTRTYDGTIELWCSMEPLMSTRNIADGALNHDQGAKFITRKQNAVTLNERSVLFFEDRLYTVHGLRNIKQQDKHYEIVAFGGLNGLIDTIMGAIYAFSYKSVSGGETTFTVSALTGATILYMNRPDSIITTGTPATDEAHFNSGTGAITLNTYEATLPGEIIRGIYKK